MSIDSRLNAIQKHIDDNAELFQVMPDFDKWNEEKLNQYIIAWHNEFTRENCLSTFEEEEELLTKWLNKDLMTQQEYDLIIESSKRIWEQIDEHRSKPENFDSAVVFINTEK